ncbi:MAG: Gfo/Idh/MocA family oxidoreductase [Thermodesulfobacteriota bacterium]
MPNFALIGAAGYIAPRHMKAIKETGSQLIAAVDKHDAVGIMDSYFPDASFFVEFERFDRHIEKLRRRGEEERVHYVSIASPNYLHDAHIRFALRTGGHAICEKPLVLNPWNVDAIGQIEKESGTKVNAILQLRLHPAIMALYDRVQVERKQDPARKYDIDVTYITSRGRWYLVSWKGDLQKSGGVATNIGIHFFDMLQWVFGRVQEVTVHLSDPTRVAGYLELESARVRWLLSIDRRDLPQSALEAGKTTYRSITVDKAELEFSEGFTDLHTLSYQEILKGNGFGLEDVKPSIQIAYQIRNATPTGPRGQYHPMLKRG